MLSGVLLWLRLLLAVVMVVARRAVSLAVNKVLSRSRVSEDTRAAGPPLRVAVIGGGIAGVSAAWALAQLKAEGAPVDVELYENRDALGGNAKTFLWGAPHDTTNSVRTGLSVLGWPAAYFKNYEVLVKRLGVDCETVHPKFVVSTDGVSAHWAHGGANEKWQPDMRRWDAGVDWIRRINAFFSHRLPAALARWHILRVFGVAPSNTEVEAQRNASLPSFYDVSLINPMNLVPAKFILCTVFGVSAEFWQTVVVPVYSSSFLTGVLDDMPAIIVPALDDIISVGAADPIKPLQTWSQNSSLVFDSMADTIGRTNIHLNAKIDRVAVETLGTGREIVTLYFSDGHKAQHFDRVIFACPATSVDKLTERSPQLRTFLFNTVIRNVHYETERDRNFVDGDIHTDRRVIPAGIQPLLFGQRFSNYVRVLDKHSGKCCNVFCLGTWIPPALQAATQPRFNGVTRETRHSSGALDLYVSYDAQYNADRSGVIRHRVDEGQPQVRPSVEKVVGHVDNSFAHPVLSPTALALASALRFLQGQHGVYFCGSYATPGNGHDLSHLSGIAAAAAVVESLGASTETSYVHLREASDETRWDYIKLRRLMGL